MTLQAKFRAGTWVRWNALAFKTDKERAGWIVVNLDDRDGLMPSYRVIHSVTGQRGSAMENELQPDNSTAEP